MFAVASAADIKLVALNLYHVSHRNKNLIFPIVIGKKKRLAPLK